MSQDETVVEAKETTEEVQEVAPVVEEVESEQSQTPAEDNASEESEDLVVSFGDEETPPQDDENKEAPEWVKQLRKDSKENAKKNKALQKELDDLRGANKKPETLTLGDKPTLENSDYDEDVYQKKMDTYYATKETISKQEVEQKEVVKVEAEETRKVYQNYADKKQSLKVKDYQAAEENVQEALSISLQNIILSTALDPAKVVYALGTNEAKLKELSTIKDPIKFAATVARMETTLKTSNRKKAPAPEKKVAAGSGSLGTSDAQFDKLKNEAYDSGDFTKFNAYKKQIKKQKA